MSPVPRYSLTLWYPEYNKEFTRIPSKRIIIRCMTLLDYFHIVHVYWCWWEDSWEQEDPLYIFHNVARMYKKIKFIYFKMCPGRWSIYIYRKCWWVPLPHPPYWFKVTGHTFAVAVNQAIYMKLYNTHSRSGGVYIFSW